MNNRGSIAYALFLILILSGLSAAILLRSVNENRVAQRVAKSSAALWSAEAGVQKVSWEYSYNNCQGMFQSGTNTACSSCTSCGGGNKTLAATLSGYGDYDVTLNNANTQIQSVGSVPSRSDAKMVQRHVQTALGKPSIFAYGVFAQGQVTLVNNSLVDSYNSNTAGYGGSNILSNGNVGTNGGTANIITVDNGAVVKGNVSTGPGGTVLNNGTINGSITNTNSVALPAVIVPSSLTSLSGNTALSVAKNSSQTIAAGDYKYTSASLSNGSTLVISGNVRLYLTSTSSALDTGQNSVNIQINSGASLTVYSDGVVNFGNKTAVTYVAGIPKPADFLIYSTYTGSDGVILNNNNTIYAGIYAPTTDINVGNSCNSVNCTSGFFGSVVGKTVTLSNNDKIHFDEALASMSNPFENAIISSWQEY